MNRQPIFIDEPEPHQTLGEARTPMRDDILPCPLLQADDLLEKTLATIASAQLAALGDGVGDGANPSVFAAGHL
jgi:hypothetical protein